MLARDDRFMAALRERFKPRAWTAERPATEFPQLVVTVPDKWDTVLLAPWYDLHIGARNHDADLLKRHLAWFESTPNVLGWLGGDQIENASKLSVGAGVYEQDYDPDNQMVQTMQQFASIRHKLLFALPGNHEDRTNIMGVDLAWWMSAMLEMPYFPDFCFCTLKWRGNNFRIAAHHGSGGAATAGAQRMAARKPISWAKPFDLYWSGHLHQALVDVLFQSEFNQITGEMIERDALIIISPSYLKYFGGYGAKKQYSPGTRGIAVVELREDGRMDSIIHARGKRL
jgi:hypothetical protein